MKTVKVMILLVIAVAAAGVAFAAPVRIGSLEQRLDRPVRVAVDTQGNVYVSEAQSDRVVIFDKKGAYRTSLTVPRPLGLAVAANGVLYVGSGSKQKNNSVFLFNQDLSSAGCLGQGACAQFVNPGDITVDGAGKVYVADSSPDVNAIRVFDASGVESSPILGTGASLLWKPVGVAIDDAKGEIFVVDYQKVYTSATAWTEGARVQVFNQAGTAIRSFGKFGAEIGQMTAPTDIALDGAGRLYVSDAYQNIVNIMNSSDGVFAGSLLDASKPGYNTTGVVVTKNGLAYVVMQKGAVNSGRVDVYALDGAVIMSSSPASLSFEGRQYAGNPLAQTVSIANAGSGTLNWTASSDKSWIKIDQSAGTTGPSGSSSINVSVDITSLTPGQSSGAVTVVSDFGQQDVIGVTVNVLKPYILNISNGWLSFGAKKGKTAPPQSVAIGVDNLTSTANWSTVSDSTWLTVAPAAATVTAAAPTASASISINTAGMAVGSYKGVITVSAPGVIGDGSTITVNLLVSPSTKISVSANRPEAKFSVRGPATYSGSGESWSVEDVPAGEYTVAFEPVSGYRKPEAQKKNVVEDEEASFSGAYVSWKDLAAKRNIIVAKGADGNNDGTIKAYKNTGVAVAGFDFEAIKSRHGANIAVGDVDGDGAADLIVGSGQGDAAVVRVLRADKSLMLEFAPFAGDSGVIVAAGDLDGNKTAEIVAMPAKGGDDEEGDSRLTVSVYDKASGVMRPSGIRLKAVNRSAMAVADVDGDGNAELVSLKGDSDNSAGSARILKVDASNGVGSWTAVETATVSLGDKVTLFAASSGDVDGDGKDEIIVAAKRGKSSGASIEVLKDGGAVAQFAAFEKSEVTGISLAAADLDGDGGAEIIVAPSVRASEGQKSGKTDVNGQFRVYGADGSLKSTLTPYEKMKSGVNVAVGELGL